MKTIMARVFVVVALIVVLISGIQSIAKADMLFCSAQCVYGDYCATIPCKCDGDPLSITTCWDWNCNGKQFCSL